MTDTIERSQTHATFVIQRSIARPGGPGVAGALGQRRAEPVVRWRLTPSRLTRIARFPGRGRAVEAGQWHGGPTSQFRSTYTDIVDQVRIVFTYDMWVDDRHISTSVTTIVLEPDGEGTRLDLHRTRCSLRRPGQRRGSGGGLRLLDQLVAVVTEDG